jgi:alkanesulfonate monooxygenase SsuD/methylene tetrahydromethanopterin reductase-like flavin-dependent oxidoreductase (luciferase family)
MKVGAVFWMHRTTWPRLREAVMEAERAGFDSLWTDDHLLPVQGDPASPKFEAWTLVSAMASLTTRPTIGVLVSSTTFRNPALLAKMAVTLDHVSGGRAILGLGSGYYEREHRAYGFDFGADMAERIDRLAEAATIIRRLLDGETIDHAGRFYRHESMVVAPRALQSRLPIMIGGMGRSRLLRVVAAVADMWNAFGSLDEISDASTRLDVLCAQVGRDPGTIERTVIRHVAVRDDAARAHRDWQAVSDLHMPSDINPERLQVGGSPAEVAAELRRHEEAGFGHTIWVFRDPYDIETMQRLADVRRMLT